MSILISSSVNLYFNRLLKKYQANLLAGFVIKNDGKRLHLILSFGVTFGTNIGQRQNIFLLAWAICLVFAENVGSNYTHLP